MKKNKLILCSSLNKSKELANTNPDCDIFLLDAYESQFDKTESKNIFINAVKFELSPENIASEIASNWYRNDNSEDYYEGDTSMGLFLEWRLQCMLPVFFRYHLACEFWLGKYKEIVVSSSLPEIFKIIFAGYDRVKFSDFSDPLSNMTQVLLRRALPNERLSVASTILRKCQKIFGISRKNKILVFNDWTYKYQTHNEFIYVNSRNFLNGAYPERKKFVSGSFTEDFKEELCIQSVKRILTGFGVSNIDSLSKSIGKYIKYEYNYSREIAERTYCDYLYLIEQYQPSSVIFPGDSQPKYSLLMQILNKKKIPHIVVMDGFLVKFEKYNFYKSRDGKDYLVKNHATTSEEMHHIFKQKFPKKCINFIRIQAPMFDYLSSINHGHKRSYDALILFPVSNLRAVFSRPDKVLFFITQVVNMLKEINLNRIAIKLKQGIFKEQNKKFVETKFSGLVDFEEGPMHLALNKTERVIGQMASTIGEAAYSSVPYYVFEPVEFGLTDSELNDSIINPELIARTTKQLRSNILNKTFVNRSIKDLSHNVQLKDIDFKSLLTINQKN